jgi:hypothetical protein
MSNEYGSHEQGTLSVYIALMKMRTKYAFQSERLSRHLRMTLLFLFDVIRWSREGWGVPAPSRVKWLLIKRHGLDIETWIETGTYLGNTTRFLSSISKIVYTIEPESRLAQSSQQALRRFSNVHVINQTSEQAFPNLVGNIKGSVGFWLDGHYSAGHTYRGENETPIKTELAQIEHCLSNFSRVVVLVDDFRCFGEKNSVIFGYPTRSFLVNWADRLNLSWTVEHDIFIAWR